MARPDKKVFPVLEGKVAIVTGAASGMGEATARLLAEAGAKVVLADFNEALGAKVAESIVAKGHEAAFVKVDRAKSEQVKLMVAFAVERFGRLDAAVNNAALKPDTAPAAEVAPGAIDTPMLKTSLEEMGLDRKEVAKKLSVLERFGQPDEVAQGSRWLASDASSFVTGTVLHIDGGYPSAM